MSRLVVACFMLLAFVAGSRASNSTARADDPEPPLRLKKKAKPATPDKVPERPQTKELKPKDPRLSKPPKKAPEDDPAAAAARKAEQQAKQALDRAARGMRDAQDRLAKKDPGEATRQVQRDVLKDLDELIKQTQRQQQQQQQQQSASSRSQQQNGRQGSRQQMTRNSRARRRQGSKTQEQQQAGMANRPGMGGIGERGGFNRIADVYKDVWGHLPETLRQEMDQYAREQFMTKYNDLLKQYYATIAAKGRKKE